MTEIPEHLLKRSQARKAGGDAAAAAAQSATTPAVAASSAPAVAAPKAEVVPAGPPPAKPDIPVVAAYKARKKIPMWAMATLSILPLWAFMYVIALRPEPVKASGPLGTGAGVYGKNCVGCHQAGGAGVAGGAYAFTDGSAMKTFPHIEDQLRWVVLGTQAYTAAGITIAGDPNREGGAHVAGSNGLMPARGGGQFTDAEILGVVCDERYALGGAPQDTEEFALWCAPDSLVYAALETGAANFENLHTVIADKGILEIGSVPKAGTAAGA
ncbi:MAG: c-type cytochrome [Ilumatobacteraceae bacterium]